MGSHFNGLHLGIAYITSFLRSHGHNAVLYNADYFPDSTYINQVELLNNTSMYKSILNDLDHPIWREIKEKIIKFNPDLIGITMLTANYKAVKIITDMAESLGIRTVIGGVHPTLTNSFKDFDYIIQGEGEYALLDFINGKHHKRSFIQNLDSLPFPEREHLLDNYDTGYISTGRGCPYSCGYCASPLIWDRKMRFRSVKNVLEELKNLKGTIHFIDDTFTILPERTKEICEGMIGLNLEWICDTRIDCIDKDILDLMKRAGCVRIKIGIESGSERILKMIHKNITKEQVRKGVRLIKESGIPLTTYFMAGFPTETNDDLKQTISFAKELKADYYSLGVVAPYYGTEIWDIALKSGQKLDKAHWEYFYHQSNEMILNDKIDPNLVREFFKLNEK
jgi:anaerobic magnesium-protoporphyrin IX monomethyl ester cyclase